MLLLCQYMACNFPVTVRLQSVQRWYSLFKWRLVGYLARPAVLLLDFESRCNQRCSLKRSGGAYDEEYAAYDEEDKDEEERGFGTSCAFR